MPSAPGYLFTPQPTSRILGTKRLFYALEAIFQDVDSGVRLVLADHQRRAEPQRVQPRAEHQQATLERELLDAIAQLGSALFTGLILDDLDTDHQPESANVADAAEPLRPRPHAFHQDLAHAAGVVHEPVLDQVDGGHRGRDRHRV